MLKIFNTLSGKKEEFNLNYGKQVNIYVCGITPSDFMHVGHARTFIMFDIIIRYLNYLGYKTYYVRNITDVSTKILKKALLNKVDYELYIDKMLQDMRNNIEYLNILKPNYELKISILVKKSIKLIKKLINQDYAYISPGGNIRYGIRKFSEYGKLSRQKIDNLRLSDFVLWKRLRDHKEMKSWDSPWGVGYPGWHTGCFTMIHELFHKKDISVDIHGGGHDLIFPHHENEVAQYEALYNKPFVKFWLHIGILLINNHKMSKSLNNCFYVKDILNIYNPEILRAYFLSSHYRKKMNFSLKAINATKQWLEKLYLTIRKFNNNNIIIESDVEPKYERLFLQAMNNDFNTVESYSILLDMAQKINYFYLNKKPGFANSLSIKLRKLANILGLLTQEPDIFLQYNSSNIEYIENLIKLRDNARKENNWIFADKIRDELKRLNVLLEDEITGTKWRKRS